MGWTMDGRRVTPTEAAKILGITPAAVRKRIKRGTLPSQQGDDGTWYVLMDEVPATAVPGGLPNGHASDLVYQARIDELKERIASLEHQLDLRAEELRRRDVMQLELARRVPELPVPKPATMPVPDPIAEPWWKRLFR